jgi:hypothetical protein
MSPVRACANLTVRTSGFGNTRRYRTPRKAVAGDPSLCDLVCLANEAKARDRRAADLADRMIPMAQEMRALWSAMVRDDKPCAHPQEWRMALDHCKDLIREGAPNLGQRSADFDPQMCGAGEEVDGGLQACRMIVKRIRQEAAIVGSEDPAALTLAAAVRQRGRKDAGASGGRGQEVLGARGRAEPALKNAVTAAQRNSNTERPCWPQVWITMGPIA